MNPIKKFFLVGLISAFPNPMRNNLSMLHEKNKIVRNYMINEKGKYFFIKLICFLVEKSDPWFCLDSLVCTYFVVGPVVWARNCVTLVTKL